MRKTVYSLVSVMLFFFVSCGGGDSNDPNPSGGIRELTSIEMSQTNATIHIGETMELTAKCLPIDATVIPDYRWKTSDENVVELEGRMTKSGETTSQKIIGKAVGTAIITVQTLNDLSATCQVTVSNSPVDVEKITLDNSEIELYEEQKAFLLATVFPVYATEQTLKWTTENKDIATVSEDKNWGGKAAVVYGGRTGTTNIVVTSNDGKVMAKCRVAVKSNNKVNYNPYGNDNQW